MGSTGRRYTVLHGDRSAAVFASAFAILALCTGPTRAQSPNGAVLAASCAACHGSDGGGSGTIPAIAPDNLAERMRAMRSAGAELTIMNRIARGYSDTELEAIANFFRTRPR